MSSEKRSLLPLNRWLEPFLALVVVGGMIRSLIYLWTHGYLPQPYFYDPYDAWMDWFNTADWAWDPGVYDAWGTVYAPLTFLVIRLLGLPYCYSGGNVMANSPYARDCDWLGVVILHGFYILNIVLISRIFIKMDRKTALPRALALSLSLPMTNSLERGNIVVIAFTCILLAHGPLLKSARMRWLAMGLAINFKIYMIASLFPYLIKRRWRWVEGAMVATVMIYVVSFCLFGKGTPMEIYRNVISYTGGQAGGLLDVWYTATYGPLLTLLNSDFPMAGQIGSSNVDLMILIYTTLTQATQLAIILALIASWVRPEAVPTYRLVGLGFALALISVESGGYSQTFVLFFALLERWKGFASRWSIVACYVLCFQFDLIIDRVPPVVRDTYYSATTEIVTYYIMAGPFVRPAIFYSIPFALACATIFSVWQDIRAQGWKERWRFRRDAPIMIGDGAARPPA